MAQVIRVRCEDKPAYYLVRFDSGEIARCSFKKYKEITEEQYFAIDEYHEVYYHTSALLPMFIIDLERIAPGLTTHSDKQTHNFDMALEIAREARNGGKPMPKPAAIKALMLFNTDESINTYDKDVFVWDSVNGVQRCSFDAYLHQIEAAHEGTYKLVKLSMARVQGITLADFRYLKQQGLANPSKSETIKMVFRSLWYAATGEEMPI